MKNANISDQRDIKLRKVRRKRDHVIAQKAKLLGHRNLAGKTNGCF